MVRSDIGRWLRESFRTPEKQLTIILSQLVIRRVIQRPGRAVIGTKMTETATGVPILWESFFGVLRVLLLVGYWDHADASFGADPCADSAAGAFLHVELVSSPEPFRKEDFLVGVFHGECSFEDVFDSFIHCPECHAHPHSLQLPVRLDRPVVQAAIDDRHVRNVHIADKVW